MKKRIFFLSLIFMTFFSMAFAESRTSYVFRDKSKGHIVEQTISALQDYNFPILSSNSAEGYIETDFNLMKRVMYPNFYLKYTIRIEEAKDGARIDVAAVVKEQNPEEKWRTERDEKKSAWWIIKVLIKRTARSRPKV